MAEFVKFPTPLRGLVPVSHENPKFVTAQEWPVGSKKFTFSYCMLPSNFESLLKEIGKKSQVVVLKLCTLRGSVTVVKESLVSLESDVKVEIVAGTIESLFQWVRIWKVDETDHLQLYDTST